MRSNKKMSGLLDGTNTNQLNAKKLKEIFGELEKKCDLGQLLNISTHLRQIDLAGDSDNNLSAFNLFMLCSGTIDFIKQTLPASALWHKICLNINSSDYNNAYQALFDEETINQINQSDAILVAIDNRTLGLDQVNSHINAIERMYAILERLRKITDKTIILQNLVNQNSTIFGSSDIFMEQTNRFNTKSVNNEIEAWAKEKKCVLFDVEYLSSQIGLSNWHDEVRWHSYKVPFNLNFIPEYNDSLLKIISSIIGKSKKCLILDLDNTLWGGVIGDDGIENIRLGNGTGEGEAFLNFQKWVRALLDRGVMLAVCSKNTRELAEEPFKSHPEMHLTLDDISVFVANWQDKASNIEYISNTLNIGLDSLVFVDDNPIERSLVRARLPEVSVPELPADPAYFVEILSKASFFESFSLTEEDKKKTQTYKETADRHSLKSQTKNLKQFLLGLEMKMLLSEFKSEDVTRITQLVNKTNQFNLTTMRLTEAEIKERMDEKNIITLQARLSDKFGDNGLISAVVAKISENILIIENWVMSCRVFQLQVEHAMLNRLVQKAREKNIELVQGTYIPTEKNSYVSEFYPNFGFILKEELTSGTLWELDLNAFEQFITPHEQIKSD